MMPLSEKILLSLCLLFFFIAVVVAILDANDTMPPWCFYVVQYCFVAAFVFAALFFFIGLWSIP